MKDIITLKFKFLARDVWCGLEKVCVYNVYDLSWFDAYF